MAFPSKKYFEITELSQLKNFLFYIINYIDYYERRDENLNLEYKDYLNEYVFIDKIKNFNKIKKIDFKITNIIFLLKKEFLYIGKIKKSNISSSYLYKLRRKLKRYDTYVSFLLKRKKIFYDAYLFNKDISIDSVELVRYELSLNITRVYIKSFILNNF